MANIKKYKLPDLECMCAHYERWQSRDKALGKENIDPERTELNYNLANQNEGQLDFIQQRIEELNLPRAPRKDAVRMCTCVLTLPKTFPVERQREFFESGYRFLSDKFGEGNVVSAWVHMDEATPHMHFAWAPITKDGRLCAKEIVSKQMLKTLHPDMQRYMEADLGTKVDVLLDERQTARKALSRLDQAEYKAAVTELERIEHETDAGLRRLEEVRREVTDVESFEAAGVGALVRLPSKREVGERQREFEEEHRALEQRKRGLEEEKRGLEEEHRALEVREGECRAGLARARGEAEDMERRAGKAKSKAEDARRACDAAAGRLEKALGRLDLADETKRTMGQLVRFIQGWFSSAAKLETKVAEIKEAAKRSAERARWRNESRSKAVSRQEPTRRRGRAR